MSPFIESLKQSLARMFSVSANLPFSPHRPATREEAHELEERYEHEHYDQERRPSSIRDFLESRGYKDSFDRDDELAPHVQPKKH